MCPLTSLGCQRDTAHHLGNLVMAHFFVFSVLMSWIYNSKFNHEPACDFFFPYILHRGLFESPILEFLPIFSWLTGWQFPFVAENLKRKDLHL